MKKSVWINLSILIVIIAIVIIPLALIKDSEFGGADGQAEELITRLEPEYEPWFSSIWEPPGGETESLLFSLQAAIGSGIIFYGLGYFRGRREKEEKEDHPADVQH